MKPFVILSEDVSIELVIFPLYSLHFILYYFQSLILSISFFIQWLTPSLPPSLQEPVTAITWGHHNQKLFVATGTLLHTATIQKAIPSLQQLSQNIVAGNLKCKEASFDLVLPTRFKFSLVESFKPIIQVRACCTHIFCICLFVH